MPIFLQMSGHAIQIQIPIFPFERDVCNIKKKIYMYLYLMSQTGNILSERWVRIFAITISIN